MKKLHGAVVFAVCVCICMATANANAADNKKNNPNSAQANPANAALKSRPGAPIAPAFRECGTHVLPEQRETVMRLQNQGVYEFVGVRGVDFVGITAHIVRRTNGTGGLTVSELCQGMEDLNNAFAPLDMYFYIAGDIDYIDSDAFFSQIDTQAEVDALKMTNPVAGTVNVYFTPQLETEDGSWCGLSSFTFSAIQGIAMSNGCVGDGVNHSTFPHEVGHYFDLFHTHETSMGVECVDGSNCATAGDLLCDTAADPGLDFDNDVSAGCSYTGGAVDSCNGDAYNPPTTNFMSYSRRSCRTVFTTEQINKAVATLMNLRADHKQSSIPVSDDCNGNLISDVCDPDCNNNGSPDDCDIADNTSADCNNNGVPDECDVADNTSMDCQPDGIPDECQLGNCLNQIGPLGISRISDLDCNICGSGVSILADQFKLDAPSMITGIQWRGGYGNGSPLVVAKFRIEIRAQVAGVPGPATLYAVGPLDLHPVRELEVYEHFLAAPLALPAGIYWVSIYNDTSAQPVTESTWRESDPDPVHGLPNYAVSNVGPNGPWGLSAGDLCLRVYCTDANNDCDENGVPDECQLASNDCNNNGILDICDIYAGTSEDCQGNDIPDECELGNCLNQLPFGGLAVVSDLDCDFCGSAIGLAADDFISTAPTTITGVQFWGFYSPSGNASVHDRFTIRIWSNAGNVPGAVQLSYGPVEADLKIATGTMFFGAPGYEYTIDLPDLFVPAGIWWVEIYNDSSPSADDWFWVGAFDDPVHTRPLHAASSTVPESWTGNVVGDMALRVFCTEADNDCNANGIPDDCEIAAGGDCNNNMILDVCETKPDGDPSVAVEHDECIDADIVCPGYDYTGNNLSATTTPPFFCGLYFGQQDVFYRYRPAWKGTLFVRVEGPPIYWLYAIYDGCPNGMNEIQCNETDHFQIVINVEAGHDYYIRIASWGLNPPGSFEMDLVGPDCALNPIDLDGNMIPDECDCHADVDNSGAVDMADAMLVAAKQGMNCTCPEDVNGDGIVDATDWAIVLNSLGPCPFP